MNMDTSKAEAALLTLIVTLIALPASTRAAEVVSSSESDDAVRQRLEKLDRDEDQRVSSAEFTAAMTERKRWWQFSRQSTAPRPGPGGDAEMFRSLDRNGDGFLSENELAVHVRSDANLHPSTDVEATRVGPAGAPDAPAHKDPTLPDRAPSDR